MYIVYLLFKERTGCTAETHRCIDDCYIPTVIGTLNGPQLMLLFLRLWFVIIPWNSWILDMLCS